MTIGVTALALGVALAAAPANAGSGNPGYSSGGATMHKHHQTRAKPLYNQARTKPLYNTVPQQQNPPAAPNYGRHPNDGGMIK